jgi:curved DNA-binding protein CbpA
MDRDATVSGDGEPDLYLVLQIVSFAEPEVIRAAYRALARKYHPDSGGDGSRMAALNRAWEVLGDRERRATYDSERRSRPAVLVAPAAPRPAATRPATGTVLDFGRYAGWSIAAVAAEDADYLRWLARTPIGRPLRAEIEERLAERAAFVDALTPRAARPSSTSRWFRPWADLRAERR